MDCLFRWDWTAMTNQPPSYALELAWQALLTPFAVSAGILSTNVFLSDTSAIVLHPSLQITTPEYHEDPGIGPGFGVFEADSSIAYETKLSADQQTPASANQAFETILQGFYYGTGVPNQFLSAVLASRLNSTGIPNFSVYGIRGGLRIQNLVETQNKTWRKEIRLRVVFLNRTNP
jgi:hypothetical protein